MESLVTRLRAVLDRHRWRRPLMIAVSGGVDSMVLLEALCRLDCNRPTELAVAHFNHRLRGRSSDADERFVRRRAAALGIPCSVGSGDVRAMAKRRGISIEAAARDARHGFFAAAAREANASTVVLAHHLDDQVELFFVRMLRGASPLGLGGMNPIAPSPVDAGVTLWRPLLQFGMGRSEIEAIAAREGIKFREDASNASLAPLRNRVRHQLVPLLREKFQPALDRVVAREMIQLRDCAEAVRTQATDWLRKRRPKFDRLSEAVQRAAVELQLADLGIAPSFDLIELLRCNPQVPTTARDGRVLSLDADGSVILQNPAPSLDHSVAELHCKITARGASATVDWSGGTLLYRRVATRGASALTRSLGGTEHFDAAKVGDRFRLRHWRAGDRFQPIGMKAAVKLQDLFVNAKVPAAERRRRVVAEAADGVLFWVEGLRISERFKLDTTSRHALKWQWRRGNGAFAGVPARC